MLAVRFLAGGLPTHQGVVDVLPRLHHRRERRPLLRVSLGQGRVVLPWARPLLLEEALLRQHYRDAFGQVRTRRRQVHRLARGLLLQLLLLLLLLLLRGRRDFLGALPVPPLVPSLRNRLP